MVSSKRKYINNNNLVTSLTSTSVFKEQSKITHAVVPLTDVEVK